MTIAPALLSFAILSSACGGIVVTGADSGPSDAGLEGEASNVSACAYACYQSIFGGQQDLCPVLLLDSSCLDGKCDLSVSTTLCGGGNGHTPPDVASVECARGAFPQCPNLCQGDPPCKSFAACLEACP